jgi:PKD repeat protein
VAPTVNHLFVARAIRTITVHVVDNAGASSTTTFSLTVAGIPPVAVLTATPTTVTPGANVQFDASGSHDPDSAISDYRWDLDSNGSFEYDSGTVPMAAHSYPNAGPVTLRVRVTDEDGNSTVATTTVTVSAPASGAGSVTGGGAATGATGSGSQGAAGGGGGQQDGSGGSSGGAGGGGFVAALSGNAIQTQKSVLRTGIAITCKTNQAATCVLTLQLAGRDARRLGLARSARKPVVIGHATVRTDGGKARVTRLRLTKKVAAKLRRLSRVTIVIVGQVTAGTAKAKVTRSVLVRRR